MYKIIVGNSRELDDVGRFIDLINTGQREFFDNRKDMFIARAPGRLDVMGGIADYSGSLVLEMPIAEATLAAVQKTEDRSVKIKSIGENNALDFEIELKRSTYGQVREIFSRDGSSHWASYVAGVFFVLQNELGFEFQTGARVLISSQIPIGKGVSSSAALEVATMQAVCAAFVIHLAPVELALLCQKVENEIVGAPCGVMDQITSNCGTQNLLISLLCQPAEITGAIAIPDTLELWGIDSGVRHAVAGSDYSSVRVGAFMGYRIIAGLAGLHVENIKEGLVNVDDDRWGGYLSRVTPAEYERDFESYIPEVILGADFLANYGGTTDPVTRIDPAKNYAVKAPTEHAIYENFRVNSFSGGLKNGLDPGALGELMFRSHESYRACGLTEPGTERIVELVRENPGDGLYGARITGGGSGGTVAILARKGSRSRIEKIASSYELETGRKPYIFSGSSTGSSTSGSLRLAWMPNTTTVGG